MKRREPQSEAKTCKIDLFYVVVGRRSIKIGIGTRRKERDFSISFWKIWDGTGWDICGINGSLGC
jgi:hypothetical protein